MNVSTKQMREVDFSQEEKEHWFCFLGIEDCIRDLTFSFDETIKHGTLGAEGLVDLKNMTFWSSTMENMAIGMCHTFIYPDKVAADMMKDAIYFSVDTNLKYPISCSHWDWLIF